MKTIRTSDQTLHIQEYGEGIRRTLIISKKPLPELEQLDLVNILVDPQLLEAFTTYVKNNLVDDVAKELGMSKAAVGRLREGLDVQKFTKPGTSATTRWRRTGTTKG